MKVIIIGSGIFGLTIFLKLISKKYDCILLEKEKRIMLGASTNNLNRVHLGYHYPRDDKTAQQSKIGSNSFIKFYKSSIIKYFQNYYVISKYNSLVNFKDYL
ncbi:FAD-dependent oxidoreductase, partial [Candidatus Pelagibacter bacterium]